MKKIVTLLLAAASFTGSFAQSQTTDEAKRIILGERRNTRNDFPVYDERSSYPGSSNRSTDRVNREYDEKIRSIRNNRTLSGAEKDRIIRDLERQRERRIRELRNYDDYGRNRRYDDDRNERKYKNKKKYKGNNGNHYGWTKGRGNRNRDRD